MSPTTLSIQVVGDATGTLSQSGGPLRYAGPMWGPGGAAIVEFAPDLASRYLMALDGNNVWDAYTANCVRL